MKRGDIVRIKRPESYWFNECGKVVSVDTTGILYPISVSYNVSCFGLDCGVLST